MKISRKSVIWILVSLLIIENTIIAWCYLRGEAKSNLHESEICDGLKLPLNKNYVNAPESIISNIDRSIVGIIQKSYECEKTFFSGINQNEKRFHRAIIYKRNIYLEFYLQYTTDTKRVIAFDDKGKIIASGLVSGY